MFCSRCGNEIPEGANLCGYCGTPVSRMAGAGAGFNQENNGNASGADSQNEPPKQNVYGESAPNYAGQAPYNGQPYPNNGYQAQGYGAPVNNMDGGAVGLAIASMVLGIVSLLLSCCISIWWLIVICAVLGIIFGAISLGKHRGGRGMAIAGIICSAVALLVDILVLAVGAAVFTAIYSSFY